MPDLGDRYRGCLLALACGDALGGPVEFESRADIAAEHPDGVRDFIGGGPWRLAPGEVTDDTQMTLALARSLARGGAYDMDDIAKQFVAWMRSGPKDIGNQTHAALTLISDGVAWDEAGAQIQREALPKGAAGNGSVMRCAPVALRFRTEPEAIVPASIDTSRITHADSRCVWSCVAVNQAIAYLLNGGTLDTVAAVATSGVEDARVVAAVQTARELPRDQVRSGGYVLATVTAAFWSLLTHDSLEDTLVAAVALGEDTDTTAAVAGALAGAYYGAEALPSRWLDLLEPREELVTLADRLLVLSEARESAV
ncbi:MAG TPA: ADP-ribosylglycohydrolase family protein [Thermomicrobiales bacterium]|nr:ADP-ribosylglycohydrolase family protein [Thermomicrobiales bacterium]